LWKQEGRNAAVVAADTPRPPFAEVWRTFMAQRDTRRLLIAIGLGAAAFAMQDALLEPFGGDILGLTVGQTTRLTGLWALGTLIGFTLSARSLGRGTEPLRIAGFGLVAGIAAFLLVIFAAPLASPVMLSAGALAIGLGVGLFSVGTLVSAMALARDGTSGLALGAWGAVQASAAGMAIALGGVIRDLVSRFAVADGLGATLADRATGYGTVYTLEICLLLVTLVVLGPLVGRGARRDASPQYGRFGLTEFPT
jgi:BCD family chlorophyll transporter-like MFS transporter